MKKENIKRLLCFCFVALMLWGVRASALTDTTAEAIGNNRKEIENSQNILPYSERKLAEETKDLLVSVKGDVELLVISSEKDFASGKFFEHYYGISAEDNAVFEESVDIYKTIAEYNQYITVRFLDPNSPDSEEKLLEFSNYQLEYGDLLVSCQTNFDGNTRIRRSLVRAKNLFEIEKKKGKERVVSSKVEEMVAATIKELNEGRDINVAYLSELSLHSDMSQLKSYLANSKYSFKGISFTDEQFYGYDMIVIAAPFRDITLEEAKLLDAFLDNGGKQGKSLAFFAPREYVKLDNLYSFLSKWGINMDGGYRLSANEEKDYFARRTRIFGTSVHSEYTESTDKNGGMYLIDKCTPMTLSQNTEEQKLISILKTDSKNLSLAPASEQLGGEEVIANTETIESYSLLAVSERKQGKKKSRVIAAASSDIITSHFSRQHYKESQKVGFVGEVCSNLDAVGEIFEKVNQKRRKEKSGLIKYAVSLKERGYEVSSGLNRNLIMAVAFGGVAFVLLLMLGIIFVKTRADRRKK